MISYGFEYFSGASVVIEIEGQPILEAASLSYSEMESKRPLYGYSSKHWDNWSSGQVIVQGSLLINYVDRDYMEKAIQLGLTRTGQASFTETQTLAGDLAEQIKVESQAGSLINQYAFDPANNADVSQAFKDLYWNTDGTSTLQTAVQSRSTASPHDSHGPLDIKVTFGEREVYNAYSGKTNFFIKNVVFLGRSQQFVIDESVIVEEYPFFARNTARFPTKYSYTNVNTGSGNQVTLSR